eukprot:NODE_22384_length_710_cov_12.737564.p1 GENE.NODE_22384_length_710_cov_12.737564~~NODE_22384_length_710_cov_12.737564.p1  ORF type:complete len:155 (+),score=58.82 NODE_22384_length_710_cov_12.737564:52-465(+)
MDDDGGGSGIAVSMGGNPQEVDDGEAHAMLWTAAEKVEVLGRLKATLLDEIKASVYAERASAKKDEVVSSVRSKAHSAHDAASHARAKAAHALDAACDSRRQLVTASSAAAGAVAGGITDAAFGVVSMLLAARPGQR